MNIKRLFTAESVLIDVESKSKKNILELISDKLSNGDTKHKDQIFDALYKREKLGTTAFGQGIAIPHARISDIESPRLLFIKLSEGIGFDAVDDKKVDIIFSLVVPDTKEDFHIELLSKVAELLDNNQIVHKIRESSDKKEIYTLIENSF